MCDNIVCGIVCVLQLKKERSMIWMDIGNGSASVLDSFDPSTIRKYFKHIYILDTRASVLAEGRKRITNMGLFDVVQVVESNLAELRDLAALSIPLHSVDIITFSYTFPTLDKQTTMAMDNATRLLKRECHCD